MTETEKYRHLTAGYCGGNGVDLGSQGVPVVPWAIQVDLPTHAFELYNGSRTGTRRGPRTIHIEGNARDLPFKDETLDFVYASHLLEDFEDWGPVLGEWVRVLKPGGKLVILVPDKDRWAQHLAKGNPPNDAHRHEGHVGELSTYAGKLGLRVLEDRRTDLSEEDYSILFVGERKGVEP